MSSSKILILTLTLIIFTSGCATKSLQVSIPTSSETEMDKGYVRIESIQDLRKFERAPKGASTPSIEGDLIEDKNITDKVIGRMRHGMYHKALWNYSLKGDKDIYSVCRKIVAGSLASAGYYVVTEGQEHYEDALPLAIDILQFWAWMQPKFNIDLHFDGELRIRSLNNSQNVDINATGTHMLTTAFAGGSAWTKVVNDGVINLDKDLVIKFEALKRK